MDISRQLITHAITARDLKPFTDAGVKKEWLLDPAASDAWQFMLEYHSTYGEVPSARVFAAEYPNYVLEPEPDPLDYVLQQARKERSSYIIDTGVYRAAHALQNTDPEAAAAALASTLAELATDVPMARAVDITDPHNVAERLARYRALREADSGLKGITTGYATLDDAIGGWRGGNLIVFAGRPKSGKSTFLTLSSIAAWESGKKILFITFEMSREQQEERIDAIKAMVSHTALRDGSLAERDFRKVEKSLRGVELLPNFWFAADDKAATTASEVIALIDELRPDAVVIDGAYMMIDERGERSGSDRALLNICQSLKFAALRRSVPILISTQMLQSKMSGEDINLSSIGYSSAFAMYADAVIGVQLTDAPLIVKLRGLAFRDGAPVDFWYYRDWLNSKFYEMGTDNPLGDDDDTGTHDRSSWYDRHNF